MGAIAAGHSPPPKSVGEVGSITAVGQKEVPPPPMVGVGLNIMGVKAKPPPGARVGEVASIAAGKAAPVAGTGGAVASIAAVGQSPKPPKAAPPNIPPPNMPPPSPAPAKPGATVGVVASIAAGKAPPAAGTEGAVPSIRAVGQNPMPPPIPGAKLGVGAIIRGVNPKPPPIPGAKDGVGATIRGKGAVDVPGAVGIITALTFDTTNPKSPMIRRLISKDLKHLIFLYSFVKLSKKDPECQNQNMVV